MQEWYHRSSQQANSMKSISLPKLYTARTSLTILISWHPSSHSHLISTSGVSACISSASRPRGMGGRVYARRIGESRTRARASDTGTVLVRQTSRTMMIVEAL